MAEYSLVPQAVPPVETHYRLICTKLPVPESLPIFEQLQRAEPRSMWGQPPIVWHRADGFIVSDRWGNRWLDWSSCVLVANVGHGRLAIKEGVQQLLDQGLLSTYVFVHEERAELCELLTQLAPDPAKYRAFLLTTGSEATENCIKLSKTWGREKHGPQKRYFVTFSNAFHGRTLGAQLAGGIPALKTWIGDCDPTFVNVPFPDGFRCPDTSFDLFLKTIAAKGIKPEEICGVMSETYQGGGADFLPVEYAQRLAAFCKQHDILLTFDEVQAGFGRTGKMFAFEHYGVAPDLIACGKGISSSLPLAAVIGRADVMNVYAPGSMTSTHSASPLCVVAGVRNLRLMQEEKLVENAARLGEVLLPALEKLRAKYARHVGCLHGKGLVAGLQMVKPGTQEPDAATAVAVNLACFHRGLLMFAPVGMGGATIKIAPPLNTTEDALREGLGVLAESFAAVLG